MGGNKGEIGSLRQPGGTGQKGTNEMQTINIIPDDYEGNPRDALGHGWADFEARIPGEDVVLPRTDKGIDYRGYITERFGASAAIFGENQCGFRRRPRGRMVALINCMWCGGVSGAVYLPESTPKREAAPGNPVNAGDTLAETAMREELAETAALAEQDARNAQHPDYCTKCHSFCYGDCEASH